VQDTQAFPAEMYAVEVSPNLISTARTRSSPR
jgi:hypothetical protein